MSSTEQQKQQQTDIPSSASAAPTTDVVLPPVAEKIPHIVKFGNVPVTDERVPRFLGDPAKNTLIDPPIEIEDPYFWFRDDERKDPKVRALLEAENKYFDHKTADQKDLAKQIYSEHLEHISHEKDESVPVHSGEWKYWKKTLKGKPFKIYARAPLLRSASSSTDTPTTATGTPSRLSNNNSVAGGAGRSPPNTSGGNENDIMTDSDEDLYLPSDTDNDNNNTSAMKKNNSNDNNAGTTSTEEEIILDINAELNPDGNKNQCDVFAVRPDPKTHSVIAYSFDDVGAEQYQIFIKKLKNFSHYSSLFPQSIDEEVNQYSTIKNTNGDIVWLPTSQGILYVTRDEVTGRAEKVWYRSLMIADTDDDMSTGTSDNNTDESSVLLYHETDALFSVSVAVSQDNNYIFIRSFNYGSTETRFFPIHKNINNDKTFIRNLTSPDAFTVIFNRSPDHRYTVESWNAGHFIAISDFGGAKSNNVLYLNEHDENYEDALALSSSSVFIRAKKERTIDNVFPHRNGLVFTGYFDGMTQIWTLPVFETERNYPCDEASQDRAFFHKCFGCFPSNSLIMLSFTEPIYDVVLLASHTKSFSSNTFRINYSSMITPNKIYEVNLLDPNPPSTNSHHHHPHFYPQRKLLKQKKVSPGYNPKDYVCRRRYALAPDGTKIPMSILCKRTTLIPSLQDLSANSDDPDWEPPQGRHPCLLNGYAAYAGDFDVCFHHTPLPLLDRGVVFVVAHCRGGIVHGKQWHLSGSLLSKRHSFQDFIACAEALIHDFKITTPSKLGCFGRSAGGLLVGSALTMRPDLWKCCVAQVPFVDVLGTQVDSSIPLVTEEWKEFGNPNIMENFMYMRSFCPITNIMRFKYPHLLVSSGYFDTRVGYWEPLKLIQKIRDHAVNKDRIDVIGKFDMEAGHFSSGNKFKWFEEMSEIQAWILRKLGCA